MRGWTASVQRVSRLAAFMVGLSLVLVANSHAQVEYPAVVPGKLIEFPRDEGSHPQCRTEWWYLTGWLEDERGESFGFQMTFFRHRPGSDESNPSRFAAKQLLFAHVSLSDPSAGRLLRDERSARAGFELAQAREGDMDVFIDDWRLRRTDNRVIEATVATDAFALELSLASVQPPLLHGRDGFSQKVPTPTSASYYYSLPQLRASGQLSVGNRKLTVRGIAWLDHEWFTAVLDEQAHGWDWVGLNLDDGSAVMAFRMRNGRGEQHWAAATWRDREQNTRSFTPAQVRWNALRHWRSARTGVEYPVEWEVTLGERTIRLRPLLDDQENDARGSTGTLYWEGAVRAYDPSGRYLGRGYLEMTGYGGRIRF